MMTTATAVAPRTRWAETTAFAAMLGVVVTVQFSIAAAQGLLALSALAWLAMLVSGREIPTAPAIFWPLAAYAGLSLLSVVFSIDPLASLHASKQLVLFLIVPLVFRLARGRRAETVLNAAIAAGALSAIYGVVQYTLLGYDNLDHRVHGTLGHWMTYSGLLMLVTCVAGARVVFDTHKRVWPALILPALVVALVVTFTRNAWVGTCVALAVLLALKDLRLIAAVPVVVAAALAAVLLFAPHAIVGRVYSLVNLNDPTSRDRISMLHAGLHIVRDHPLTGVGEAMIGKVYPQYRLPDAVLPEQPHLHNVPLQIAAERGLPALAAWLWFIWTLVTQALRRFRSGSQRERVIAASALAAIGAMLGAGLFEYNFGDSEFLMLFLVLVTLPSWAVEGGRRATGGASS
jgi:O-antigen ligase